jgi:hypothetical protein
LPYLAAARAFVPIQADNKRKYLSCMMHVKHYCANHASNISSFMCWRRAAQR